MRPTAIAVVAAACSLAACGATPPLPAKSAVVPEGLDLSGEWQLRPASRDTNRRISEAERRAAGPGERLIPGSSASTRRRGDDIQVHVFLESGSALRITQTDYGLFISFDRAIVEEYRFGEQRLVRVGPIQAERVSGWENNAYVIETRDKEGTMLIESYRLENDDTMRRRVRITGEPAAELDVEQVFDRR
jgi:hypothetical protein